jgi:small subunit ribosomal protein S7
MPRKGNVPKREVLPDPIYNSTLVSKFVNCVMSDGKKSTAEHIFYDAMKIIQEKTSDDPLKVFKKAVDNVKPVLEVKTRRVGGANYQVPVEVNPNRRTSLSIRWLVGYSRDRKERSMEEKLPRSFWMRLTIAELQSRSAKTFTRWPRPTRPLRIIAGR